MPESDKIKGIFPAMLHLAGVEEGNHGRTAKMEERQLLNDFSGADLALPKEETLLNVFEEQVLKTPFAVAVEFEGEQLSYSALSARANQLAHFLRRRGVKEETLVPICIDRSLEMIIGIFGILKAGGAYVPVDPAYPRERILYMLEDTAASIVLCSSRQQELLGEVQGREVVFLDIQAEFIGIEATQKPATGLQPHHLAYVIYTSGSTGKPKGVMVEHRHLLVSNHARISCYGSSGSVFLIPSFSFDSSVAIIFWALSTGGRLLLSRNELLQDLASIGGLIKQSDTILCVPGYYSFLLEEQVMENSSVSKVIVAGEKVAEALVLRHESRAEGVLLYNEYGPTECTVWASVALLSPAGGKVTIGRPILNTRIYIRGNDGELLPPGESGEICIGGKQVSRGYLNREELTREKFISDPYSIEPGARLYRTGDVGRWLADGNIEYLGRNDEQVKIRGYRIELGEIESLVQQSKLVERVVVQTKEGNGGGKSLVAFIISKDHFQREEMLAYLKGRLPEYMIPAVWVELKEFPLTPNGKIDKKALPELEASAWQHDQYLAPRTAEEEKLAKIWEELLQIERLGVKDDFFALGGHSLLAMRLISRIRQELKAELAIKDLFAYPTIEKLAELLYAQDKKVLPEIIQQVRPQRIPLSFGQDRLWFIDQLEGSVQYHIPMVLRLEGRLDTAALELSLRSIVNRHEVLRTVIKEEEGKGYQFIKPLDGFKLTYTEGPKLGQDPVALQQQIEGLTYLPFDLAVDNMLRASLLRLDEQSSVLVVIMHHIASDGWSESILMNELLQLYGAYAAGRKASLPALPLQYADYALWQQEYLQGETLLQKLSYWKKKLEGVAPLELPTDHSRPAVQSRQGAEKAFKLNKELVEKLQLLSRQEGSTLFMGLLAAFKILLYRYSGQEDICVGTPTSGRQQHELEGLIGFFVNTLALRSHITAEASYREVLQQLKESMLEGYEHQDAPFEKVVEAVVKERDLSRNPLFQVMFVLQNTPEIPELALEELMISNEGNPHTTAQCDITFVVKETVEGLQGSVEYSTALFEKETIERMIGHYGQLLEGIVNDPGQKVSLLPMLSRQEEQRLLREFNWATLKQAEERTVLELFASQAAKSPQSKALIFDGEHLTYQELDERSRQLAHYLYARGVKEETLVPICLDRSLEMLIGILGILKAGGAYVPVDPAYPAERINYILEDTAAALVVSSKDCLTRFNASGRDVVLVDSHWEAISEESCLVLLPAVQPHQLAYVIYTSGSTGKPKGVMIEHRQLLSSTQARISYYGACGTAFLVPSFAFDSSVAVIFWAISTGGNLLLSRRGQLQEAFSLDYLLKEADTLLCVPSYYSFLLEAGVMEGASLSKVIVAGEKAEEGMVIAHENKTNGVLLFNEYGPTECTVWASACRLDSNNKITIGSPLATTKIYLLDAAGALLPVGVPGEICIGGSQVGRGYLNKAELTEEKFINNPFDEGRLYRSGDVGKWLPDGSIEFLGRIDDQLKIRGYRIEAGEIENVLQQHDLVEQAVVLAKTDKGGNKCLVGYVKGSSALEVVALMSWLKERLPEYMIPGLWVRLEKFPLSPNGKIDRKALPEPDASALLQDEYVEPATETERQLVILWQEVLQLDKIGVRSNFFKLGGHSLLAMRLISRIRRELKVELAVKELFVAPTIAGLALHLQKQGKASLPEIVKRPRPALIPLSFGQDRLWFIDQLEGSVQYHMPIVLRLQGSLGVAALEFALRTLVNRHEILRTVIREEEGQGYQHIKPEGGFQLEFIQGHAYRQDKAALQQQIEHLVYLPFNLQEDSMLRASLIRLDEKEHVLVLNMHHIASDGWSVSILMKELIVLYEGFQEGRDPLLPALELQYADFALWQREYLQGEVLEQKLSYWKKKLQEVSPLELPTDFTRPAVQSRKGAEKSFQLDRELTDKLQLLSQQEDCTLFMSLLAAFKVLLYRYSGQEDICVGTPAAGRQQQELEGLIGFFVNTLALRSQLSGAAAFTEVLQQLKATMLEAYEHQEAPFEKVVEAVVKERDLSRSPLFQVMFVFQNLPEIPELQLKCLSIGSEVYQHNNSLFDITFIVRETPEGISGVVEYNTDLYDGQTITRMIAHYEALLRSIVENPAEKTGLLQMLTAPEEEQLLHGYNPEKIDNAGNNTLINLFEEQLKICPEAVAVVVEEGQLSYQELDQRANRLANYLQARGVKEDVLVPVCLDRSLEMIVGILGILKAGGAYVPVDPAYPKDRISFILEDSGASIVVSSSSHAHFFTGKTSELVLMDTHWEAISAEPVNKPAIGILSSNLAYMIYTSGSTGKPKGVLVEHGNIIALLLGFQELVPSRNEGRGLSVCPFVFDVSVWEFFINLCFGNTLYIVKDEHIFDPVYLSGFIERNSITTAYLPPTILPEMVATLEASGQKWALQRLLVGVLPIKQEILQRFQEKVPGIRIVNGYGPTEATVCATFYLFGKNPSPGVFTPIGKPVQNYKIYVLDRAKQLVPQGVAGEIYIGGEGVSRGYLNRQALTKEKFVEDPFSSDPAATLYRTGDVGKWLPDGNLEFIGRTDEQLKIRGYRIEPGEIESILQQHEMVEQALVGAKPDREGFQQLVGYVVVKDAFDREMLMGWLKERLPEYMIPGLWVWLEKFPLSPNGKIDRKALPEPDASALLQDEYVEPATEAERQLVILWQEVLQLDKIGVRSNFFKLGGHSLLAMRLISRIRRELKVELAVKELFVAPTIAGLAMHLQEQSKASLPEIVKRPRPALIPLSFGQDRLWFIDQLEGSVQYHMPIVLRLQGSLGVAALEFALRTLVNRHEILRTVIREEEGQGYQHIKPEGGFQLEFIRGHAYRQDKAALQQQIEHLVYLPFNLQEDSMLRASLIRLDEKEHVLVLNMHHIASDGWSVSILMKELIVLYEGFQEGRDPLLPALQLQYADFALWQREYLQGEVLEQKLSYWKKKLQEVSPLELPTDFTRPAVQSRKGAEKSFQLDRELTDKLQLLSQQEDCTLFMSLLAAFKVLLYRYSGQEDICVGTPAAGRQQQELEGLIGFFVNTLALRSQLSGGAAFTEVLRQLKATMLEAYEHQEAPFEKVVEAVVKERDLSRSPLFQVMFVFHNATSVPEIVCEGLSLSKENYQHTSSQFDITFVLIETAEGLGGVVEYCTDLYMGETIERMIGHYEVLLKSIVNHPAENVSLLPMLPKVEEDQILLEFNGPNSPLEPEKTILDLFEEQVKLKPEAVAMVFEEQHLTYRELDERSNQLAHYLRAKGVKQETLVPICLDRSPEMVIGIMGILKAGGAYVPVDPAYPEERILYMLEDTACTLLLSRKAYAGLVKEEVGREIVLLDAHWGLIAKEPVQQPNAILQPYHLAYVIYTSGSTGRPKGVMVEHRQLVNSNRARIAYYSHSGAVFLVPSFSFDSSVAVLFWTLTTGGKLLLCKNELVQEVHSIRKMLEQSDTILCVPSYYRFLLEDEIIGPSNISKVILAGEKFDEELVIRHERKTNGVLLFNEYGPTEGTIWATVSPLSSKEGKVTIGKPIPNANIYITGTAGELMPVGIAGEICIGGSQVARGYLNQPSLTAEKFVRNPFSGKLGGRMYRTGDLARWLPDGNIEFIGRTDEQLKIRGYRIEPGEVEGIMQQSELVAQALVVAKADSEGNQQLVSYVVPKETYNRELMIAWLKNRLPEYMVPALWVELACFTLTPNGKIDIKALPVPDGSMRRQDEYLGPRTMAEEQLVKIYQELLQIERVGVKDNFFELGGHSLLAMRLISRIRRELKAELAIKDLFTYPTIAGIAKYLQAKGNKAALPGTNFSFLVPIKEAGGKIPFYIICGTGGTAYKLREFAHMLDVEQPVYGLQQPSDKRGLALVPASIEEIAYKYVEELLIHNPEGPYALSGHCVGGPIVLEMARHLEAKGKKVVFLALFDPVVRTQGEKEGKGNSVSGQFPSLKTSFISSLKLKIEFEWFLWRHFPLEALDYKWSKLNSKLNPFFKRDEDLEAFDKVSQKYEAAIRKYRLNPYSGEVTAFFTEYYYHFADKKKNIYFKKEYYDSSKKVFWGQHCRSMKSYEIDGEHSNMFDAPYGIKLARLVQQSLDSCRKH